MNKKTCGIIRDLLPLYAENICSEDSRAAVAEHIADCADCHKLLDKMNTTVGISPETDIAAIKRIKKRIRTEKIAVSAIAAAVILTVCWSAYFFLVNTACSMDYRKYNLSDNLRIEENENGDLWLCKKGEAASADFIYPTLSDKNGSHLSYDKNFDSGSKSGYGVTLKHRRVDELAFINICGSSESRSFLLNKSDASDINYIFYYDDKNETEYILWERN